jgi:arylsulfatase A-like enzyme
MKRHWFFAGIVFAGLLFAATNDSSAAAKRKPNILIIVSDDQGYAEMSCQGGDIHTPNMDSIAKSGVRFTSGYVSCPVCSPTRAGLLTGRYQQRFGHEFNPGPPDRAEPHFGLPVKEKTIADVLKSAGYATGMVGKWHLGLKPEFHPMRRGFDEFFGFLHGAHSYVDARADSHNPIMRGTNAVDAEEYLTDAFTREAVAFIDRHQKEPFFLYLTYNAVHTPLQSPQKYLDRVKNIQSEKRRTYAAMLVALDDGVGAVLRKLREAGIDKETLLFFVSDNGGPTAQTTSRNDPLRGFKGQVWEGGIRVPFMVQWPDRIPAGKVYDQPVIALDILSTAVAAAGGKLPENTKTDGVNLLPYLTGEKKSPPHESLFWRYGGQSAMRRGDWKLVMIDDKPPQLFDLAGDNGEQIDLAGEKPDVLKQLKAAYDQWNSQLAEPLWATARQAQRANRPAKRRQ